MRLPGDQEGRLSAKPGVSGPRRASGGAGGGGSVGARGVALRGGRVCGAREVAACVIRQRVGAAGARLDGPVQWIDVGNVVDVLDNATRVLAARWDLPADVHVVAQRRLTCYQLVVSRVSCHRNCVDVFEIVVAIAAAEMEREALEGHPVGGVRRQLLDDGEVLQGTGMGGARLCRFCIARSRKVASN